MEASPPSRENTPAAKQSGAIQAALGIAAALLGLGAYVYLLGGFVLWLKFTAARLPTDDAVGPLGGNRLLAVGMKALIFELVLVAVLLGLAFLAWETVRYRDVKAAKKRTGEATEAETEQAVADAAVLNTGEKWEAWRKLLQALIVGILAGALLTELLRALSWANPAPWLGLAAGLLAAGVWLKWLLPEILRRTIKPKSRRRAVKTWLTVLAAIIAAVVLAAPAGVGVLVLLLFLHLSHFLKELPKVTDPVHLIPAVLIVAGGLSLVVAAYLATPPVSLDNTVIVMEGSQHRTIVGGFVGRTSDGVYLAACQPSADPTVSGTAHLRVVLPERIRRIVLGGKSDYALDDGSDSSLLDAGRYLMSSEDLPGEWFDTVSLDARDSELTCGFPSTLTIGRRPRDPRSGRIAQEATVPGGGTVTLSGDYLQPRRVDPDAAGDLRLPIALQPEVRAAHRCEGPFSGRVRVEYDDGDGAPESKEAAVILTSATGLKRDEQGSACHRAWVHQGRIVASLPAKLRANAR